MLSRVLYYRGIRIGREGGLAMIAMVPMTVVLAGCSDVGRGMEGNIYEKMSIFSFIALTIMAAILIPLVGGSNESKASSRYRELIRNAAANPLSASELVEFPVFVWDSPKSFHKMLFANDNSLSESAIVTTNGLDPGVKRTGTWTITSSGGLLLSRNGTARPKTLTRVSRSAYHLPTIMLPDFGHAETWFLGASGLADAQISCFSYPGSLPSSKKFTASLVNGLTVYWATYPCRLLTSGNEISVNPLLAYGMITFHPDGTLSRSINNPIDAAPDFKPSFTGIWDVNENLGVLNLSAGQHTTEVTMLFYGEERHCLLVGTETGNEQWFLDPEKAKQDLAGYLADGAHLDAEKALLYG